MKKGDIGNLQGNRRMGMGHHNLVYNPFNPLQSYLLEYQQEKEMVNSVANQKLSYFLGRDISEADERYRKMIQNQLLTGVKNDEAFKNYMSKVHNAVEQSQEQVSSMRVAQLKAERLVKSAKCINPKNAVKHLKMTNEDFAINNCAQITDMDELKKQIQQIVHVNQIKNFVQKVKNKKQIKYLNQALNDIKESHYKKIKPIKYLVNENKDPRALVKPLRMPVTDFKVVKLKQKPLDLNDDLQIDFFQFDQKPHQIVVAKKTAEHKAIQENEIITELGFKLRLNSEISVLSKFNKQVSPANPSNPSSPNKLNEEKHLFQSRRTRDQARQNGLFFSELGQNKQHPSQLSPTQSPPNQPDGVFMTSVSNPHLHKQTRPSSMYKSNFEQHNNNSSLNSGQEQSSIQFNRSDKGFERITRNESMKELPGQGRTKLNGSESQSKINSLMGKINDYQNGVNSTSSMHQELGKISSDYQRLQNQYFSNKNQQQFENLIAIPPQDMSMNSSTVKKKKHSHFQ